jgi:hypothetical protein
MREIGPEIAALVASTLMLSIALVALPLATLLALALIGWFRARVARSMRSTATTLPLPAARARCGGPSGALAIERIQPAKARADAARALPLVARARHHVWQLAGTYAAAAAVYAFLLATGMILAFAPGWHSILAFALLYLVYTCEMATPVALAPTVVLKRQPRFLVLAVLALIALMWVLERILGVDPIGPWLMIAAVPTAAVLLLNARRLRAVGPIVFAGTLLLLYGVLAGLAYGALYVVDLVGPVRFVRDDLAELPLWHAAERYLAWLRTLPLDRILIEVAAAIDEPSDLVLIAHPERFTAGPMLRFFAIWLAAAALGAGAAWALVRWLARRYRAQRASDQMLSIDILVLVFALPIFFLFVGFDPNRWPFAFGALAGFAAYKLVAGWGLRQRRRARPPPAPDTLLLLRVFGFDRRTQRLLEDLGQRWRCLGPIHLIGGTDLAYATIEPHEFFEFLNGRLSRAFIKGEADLEARLKESSVTPDPDGLFRIEDFFCHDDTWRMTVSRLARQAAAVLMDLRGFTPANRGCIFEIEELIAVVPVDRIVLLVDRTTDVPFLERTLEQAWQTMPADSPNVVAGQPRLRVLEGSASHRRTLATLLGLLCERPAERAPAG